jgi:predicted DCC family thiol-disulfide oxidoreductase YuxK
MCSAEMRDLRRRDAAGRLELVDCSAPEFSDEGFRAEGKTRSAFMARLHARDAHGQWLVGADAFEAIYSAVGLERIASVWGSPRLRPLVDRAYHWIARNRQVLSRVIRRAATGRAESGPLR